jgi:hypothetical protein
MTQQPEQAPRPVEIDPLQLRQATVGTRSRPMFVPPSVRRATQAMPSPGMRTPPPTPGGPPFARPGRQAHVPRAFQRADDGGPGRAGVPGRVGATHGATTVAAQYSVDYPDDLWFYDANGGWVKLDTTSENGLELMNAIVSHARQTQRPMYYDTDDTTGNAVDVYLA